MPDDTGRITRDNGIRRDLSCHDSPGADNNTVPQLRTGQNTRIPPDPDIVAQGGVFTRCRQRWEVFFKNAVENSEWKGRKPVMAVIG